MLIVGGAKLHSLLSAHHLIDAYFLTSEGDKCISACDRLLMVFSVAVLILVNKNFSFLVLPVWEPGQKSQCCQDSYSERESR